VAFFTLIERNFIALGHFRLGPNKVGPTGVLQPFRDAVKLLTKETYKLKKTIHNFIWLAPIMFITLSLIIWIISPMASIVIKITLAPILFIVISSVRIFFFISRGWASISKYRIIGSYRSTAQTISYEITILIILLPRLIMMLTINRQKVSISLMPTIILNISAMVLIWLITILAETNRTPFDLTEGESELVSGYNTEYSGGQFSMIFISEYRIIIFISILTYFLFIGLSNNSYQLIIITIIMVFFVWSRISFPRIRYDMLIRITWKTIIPIAIAILLTETTLTIF